MFVMTLSAARLETEQQPQYTANNMFLCT